MHTVYYILNPSTLRCTISRNAPTSHHVGSYSCLALNTKFSFEYGKVFQAEDFWKGHRMSEHLPDPFRFSIPSEPDVVLSLSLLKSALQKCIRRRETDQALSIAKTMMYVNFKSFVRRLFVIAAEDVLLDESALTLVWMLKACDFDYKPSKHHVEWLLSYVRRLCQETSCVMYRQDERLLISGDQPMQIAIRLYLAITDLMKFDTQLLKWYHNHPEVIVMGWVLDTITSFDVVPYITKSTFPLYGIDFHTSPHMVHALHTSYPKLSEERIKELIWRWRSSTNARKPLIADDDDRKEYDVIKKSVEDLCARILHNSVQTRL